ncbi:MAG: non-canonical purine NTP pyrophosphatase, RdgB/HAM1 family [Flavobacteriaceae bacterium]|nr:non-canonical purine NTP pyrophosphatase, RdgB/HAM1 family [Flavobacteriaceae bacterium]
MRIIFATHNNNKLLEVKKMISKKIEIKSLSDLGYNFEIPENEKTIEENAIFKAKFIYSKFKLNVFADDTGLEVEALGGKPGVHSARYAGNDKDNKKNIKKLLDSIRGIENRKANFKTVISLIFKDKLYVFEGKIYGKISDEEKGLFGFGYDPVFIPEGFKKTFGELNPEIKNTISHRAIAFNKLISFIKKNHDFNN